jgi:1-acyl-sn-glycerol-3-phosphate acyltransferase
MTRAARTGSIFANRADAVGGWGRDPSAFEPAFVQRQHARISRMFGPGRYFGVDAQGWENVPDGASLLVSNHSGGTTVLDAWGLVWSWYDRWGFDRPLHGLAHEAVFATQTTGRFFARGGVLRASPESAAAVLGELKRPLLVMPGGDRDVWRPASERYHVRFAGRRGYARTAVEQNVPVVPVAHVGAHHTLLVLTDGRAIARRLGIKRIARAEIFPVHLSFPWGLAIGPWPHLPPPTTLHYRIGAPLYPSRDLPFDEAVADLDLRTQAAIQALLDGMRGEAPVREGLTRAVRGVRATVRRALGRPAELQPAAR